MAVDPARLAAATEQLRDLRRQQTALTALAQKMTTSIQRLAAVDWEERYVAEGIHELETLVNDR